METGTMETPRPAAIIFPTEVICGTSCPITGSKPARLHAEIVSSKSAGPALRGKSTKGSFAKAESGNQAGDPAKAAQVLLKVIAAENPPVHLLLGNDAVKMVREKLEDLTNEIKAWEEISCSTDFT
jgi:hypothetical protein